MELVSLVPKVVLEKEVNRVNVVSLGNQELLEKGVSLDHLADKDHLVPEVSQEELERLELQELEVSVVRMADLEKGENLVAKAQLVQEENQVILCSV